MRCPWCGIATAFHAVPIKADQAYLPESSSETCQVFGPAVVLAITESSEHSGYLQYAVVACQECGKHFVVRKDYSDEWHAIFPYATAPVPDEIPEPIRSHLAEAQLSLAVEAHVACLLVCRTALIAIQRDKTVTNLKGLTDAGLISVNLCAQADEIRLWANMLAHEDVPAAVAHEDCEQLIGYIKALTNALYVEPAKLAKLRDKRKDTKGLASASQ